MALPAILPLADGQLKAVLPQPCCTGHRNQSHLPLVAYRMEMLQVLAALKLGFNRPFGQLAVWTAVIERMRVGCHTSTP